MTRAEKYAAFLLLTTEHGDLRQRLEGVRTPNGAIAGAPGPANTSDELVQRARTGLANLGIHTTAEEDQQLPFLFDQSENANVTTDNVRLASALSFDDYSGNCPDGNTENRIVEGVRQAVV